MDIMKPKRSDHPDGGYDYKVDGKFHREDGPAVVNGQGDKWWFRNNLLHREDGPAVEHASGSKWWYQNGQLHRTDGPAYQGADGTNAWYINGRPAQPPSNSKNPKRGKDPRP